MFASVQVSAFQGQLTPLLIRQNLSVLVEYQTSVLNNLPRSASCQQEFTCPTVNCSQPVYFYTNVKKVSESSANVKQKGVRSYPLPHKVESSSTSSEPLFSFVLLDNSLHCYQGWRHCPGLLSIVSTTNAASTRCRWTQKSQF